MQYVIIIILFIINKLNMKSYILATKIKLNDVI